MFLVVALNYFRNFVASARRSKKKSRRSFEHFTRSIPTARRLPSIFGRRPCDVRLLSVEQRFHWSNPFGCPRKQNCVVHCALSCSRPVRQVATLEQLSSSTSLTLLMTKM